MALTQSDLPPQKVPHVPGPSPAPTETVDHEDRTVFRCLSCFSFFIPTEIKTDSRDSSESMPGAANLGEKGTTIAFLAIMRHSGRSWMVSSKSGRTESKSGRTERNSNRLIIMYR
ncbi:uncharacterized protein A4U43_C07F4380 [Asparagus officinalis]|uniref:Uncharacterized protein n=1 Tax=Asparagus officinalis TaxID=4686 RepID=A0A5P1ECN6_ASPOF|nr:uncharacterized protein A4U43_C07F4380 [Asparagus officinalis]